MTHEQLIAKCTQWFWNEMVSERRMLYAVNNNVSAGLTKHQQIIEGNKNKAKGVVSGVLDLCLIGDRRVMWLDAKIGNDRPSEEQLDFVDKCHKRGHVCAFFSSFEEFQELVFNFLS